MNHIRIYIGNLWLRIILLLLTLAETAQGQEITLPLSPIGEAGCVVVLDSLHFGLCDSTAIGVQMEAHLLGLEPKRGRYISLTPRLVGATDSVDFPSLRIYSRWAYYHEVRNGRNRHDASNDYVRARDAHENVAYARTIPLLPWMSSAVLKFVATETDDCGNIYGSTEYALPPFLSATAGSSAVATGSNGAPQGTASSGLAADAAALTRTTTTTTVTTDTLHVVDPGRIRHFEGSAFIDYPLDRTEIFPDYHDNTASLEEIRATIDSVLQHDRSLLQHITLKGFASPEGSYAHNEELARGRVHSLRRYLVDNFNIPGVLITAEYEPEDWEGLRRHVNEHRLPHYQQMLDIIDSDRHPDDKLARIRYLFPYTYQHLLKEVFPFLRHTDYRIDYLTQEADSTSSVIIRRQETTTSVKDTLLLAAGATEVSGMTGKAGIAGMPPSTGQAGSIGTSFADLLPLENCTETRHAFRPFRAHAALKTNLLFDAALAPNVELEIPFGRSRWSLMVEDWFPWFRLSHNEEGDVNPYYRSDQRPTRHSYEIWVLGAELRYWFSPRCNASRPALCGTFVGIYGAGGKYDVEWKSKGDQGEFTSIGLTFGRSWPIARHWNLELSGSIGYVGGPQRHYEAEFDDARLIFRHYNSLRYFGPTKLKLSIGYIF